jgi:hypothetical protein
MKTTCSTSFNEPVRLFAGIARARLMLGKAADAATVDNSFRNSRRSVLMWIHTSPDCCVGNREPQISPVVLRFHDDSVFILRLTSGTGFTVVGENLYSKVFLGSELFLTAQLSSDPQLSHPSSPREHEATSAEGGEVVGESE